VVTEKHLASMVSLGRKSEKIEEGIIIQQEVHMNDVWTLDWISAEEDSLQ
jgi:hypothetical protein